LTEYLVSLAPILVSLIILTLTLSAPFLFAYASYVIAKKKGRNKSLWAFLGFFFTGFALLVLALLPEIVEDRIEAVPRKYPKCPPPPPKY
jgi:hypothetical protein